MRLIGRAQHRYVRETIRQAFKPTRTRACRQHQPLPRQHRAGTQCDGVRRAVDRRGRIPEMQRDTGLAIPVSSLVRLRRFFSAFQERLGQWRPVIWLARLLAHQMHTGALPGLDQ